jgi:SAM-dependent methyltransferase
VQPAQMWGLGEYATVGDRFAAAGIGLVKRLVRPGDTVLDVATGPGVVAIAAAAAGATVTGLDVAPKLLAQARARAAAAGVEVRWVEANMTAIPEPDAGYDRVLSAFGAMFAPDPAAMAAELLRLVRPDGVVGLLAWTPESPFCLLGPVFAAYLPPDMTGPPIERWGTPGGIREVFAGLPVLVQTEPAVVDVQWPSLETAVDEITTLVPGAVAVRAVIEPTGEWPRAVADTRDMLDAFGRTADGGFVLPVPYLITLARRG